MDWFETSWEFLINERYRAYVYVCKELQSLPINKLEYSFVFKNLFSSLHFNGQGSCNDNFIKEVDNFDELLKICDILKKSNASCNGCHVYKTKIGKYSIQLYGFNC